MKNAAVALAAAAMLLAGGPARASGPDPKYVPADAKWVVHADVDRMAKTQMYEIVMRQAEKDDPKVREKVAKFGEALGSRIPEDVHGVTLVGRAFDEKSVVLIVRAKLDKNRLLGMAKAMPGFTSNLHGTVEVATWKDPNEPESVSGAFLADDVLVLGWTPADVGRMLDLAAGREKPAPADGLLAGAADGTEVMAYLAANGLAELQRMHPVSPLISQVTSARVSLAERGDDLTLRAVLSVTSPEIANQVKGATEGFKALLGLAALDDDGDEEAKAAAEIVQRATVTAEGSTVKLDLPMPMARLRELIEQDRDNKKPASGPTTRKAEGGEKAEKSDG
ncbi:MAG: hypothetical protein WBD40_05950 [Tepidisphaeraceae bacterium]